MTPLLTLLLALTAEPRFAGFTEPIQQIDVAAPESGTVREVHVRPGDSVRAGQILAGLDRDVLEATLEIARLKAASTTRRDAAQVELQVKQKRLDNMQGLRRDGFGSPEELERAKADASLARIELQAAEEELRLNKLEEKRIEAQLERRLLRSPLDGVLSRVHREAGEYVPPSEPRVVTVVRLDRLKAKFHVPTAVALRLRPGAAVAIEFEDGTRAPATVDFIAPTTHAESGTVLVETSLGNGQGRLRSGVPCWWTEEEKHK